MKRILSLLSFLLLALSFSVFAQQSGDNSDVRNACDISGGTWTESGSGNWACCWADWGCYGCVDGICKIKCTTQRCRKANGQARVSSKNHIVEGLAPSGSKAPVAPKPKVSPKESAAPAAIKSE